MRLSISMGCFGTFWSFGSEKRGFWETGIALGWVGLLALMLQQNDITT